MGNQTGGLLIDPQEVEAAFQDCSYREEELDGARRVPEGAVVALGVIGRFELHPGRLEERRIQVMEWLKALPHQFHKSVGGGSSFLNACNQWDGVQWTGQNQDMDRLFILGMGLGLVESQVPREMWSALPGGMPYYVISVE